MDGDHPKISTPSSNLLVADVTTTMGPPRILLAEDDPDLRALVQLALEQEGYDVVAVPDGLELVDELEDTYLAEEDYDLVLTDIRMPGCTGLDALESLRDRDWATPVVFMTAFGSRKTHREAHRLGATVVDKPFDLDDLVAHVRAQVPPTRYAEGWN